MGTLAPPGLPLPDLQLGELQMADGIMLTAKKFNLAITFFYHAQESLNAEYGRVRSASTRCQVLSSTSSTRVSLLRGDFRELGFTKVGTSGAKSMRRSAVNPRMRILPASAIGLTAAGWSSMS